MGVRHGGLREDASEFRKYEQGARDSKYMSTIAGQISRHISSNHGNAAPRRIREANWHWLVDSALVAKHMANRK